MAGLAAIAEALTRLESNVTTELAQIAEKMRDNPTQAEVEDLAGRIDAVSNTIANIIPDDAPPGV